MFPTDFEVVTKATIDQTLTADPDLGLTKDELAAWASCMKEPSVVRHVLYLYTMHSLNHYRSRHCTLGQVLPSAQIPPVKTIYRIPDKLPLVTEAEYNQAMTK
eukprot:6470352-Amphidinium_carterae.1